MRCADALFRCTAGDWVAAKPPFGGKEINVVRIGRSANVLQAGRCLAWFGIALPEVWMVLQTKQFRERNPFPGPTIISRDDLLT
jgi:hypothetical protein